MLKWKETDPNVYLTFITVINVLLLVEINFIRVLSPVQKAIQRLDRKRTPKSGVPKATPTIGILKGISGK